VNRRLVLVGLVIDGQSEGHGVTPIDLSTKPGQPQSVRNLRAFLTHQCTRRRTGTAMTALSAQILEAASRRPEGSLLAAKEFLGLGKRDAVDQALHQAPRCQFLLADPCRPSNPRPGLAGPRSGRPHCPSGW